MNELSANYAKLLQFGLLAILEAARLNDVEWAKAEAEFLHNIPSLLDEANVKRHEYFWFCERESHIDWVNSSGGEGARKWMKRYEEIWREMEPILLESFSNARAAT